MTLDGVLLGATLALVCVGVGYALAERRRDEQDGRENDLGGIIAQQAGRIGELEAYIRDHSDATAEDLGL